MNLKRISRTVLLLAAPLLLFPREAHAYLDPGSGSLIVQALVAAFFALSLAIKAYWRKIKLFVGGFFLTGPEVRDGDE
ncbi:MAG: hypothetical protein OXB98_15410 [Bryobacterales bacterium]|nr:hypothetical protein [Bryobacterales bacterium]